MAQEMDTPLSQSNVSLKLSEIQRRCEELMDEELSELRLEEPGTPDAAVSNSYNPYNRNE